MKSERAASFGFQHRPTPARYLHPWQACLPWLGKTIQGVAAVTSELRSTLAAAVRISLAGAVGALAWVALSASAGAADDGDQTLLNQAVSIVEPTTSLLAPAVGLMEPPDGAAEGTNPTHNDHSAAEPAVPAGLGDVSSTETAEPVIKETDAAVATLPVILDAAPPSTLGALAEPPTPAFNTAVEAVREPSTSIAQPLADSVERIAATLPPLAAATAPVSESVESTLTGKTPVSGVLDPVLGPIIHPLKPVLQPVREALGPVTDSVSHTPVVVEWRPIAVKAPELGSSMRITTASGAPFLTSETEDSGTAGMRAASDVREAATSVPSRDWLLQSAIPGAEKAPQADATSMPSPARPDASPLGGIPVGPVSGASATPSVAGPGPPTADCLPHFRLSAPSPTSLGHRTGSESHCGPEHAPGSTPD